MTNQNESFIRHPIDGTERFAVPLTIAEEIYLKWVDDLNVIALSMVSPVSKTSGESIRQQWAITLDQAKFLRDSLDEILREGG